MIGKGQALPSGAAQAPLMWFCAERSLRGLVLLAAIIASTTQVARANQEAAAGAAAAVSEDHPSKQQGWSLLNEATKRRTFYKYERRIRDFSGPDKVFHYFASESLPDGTRVMSPADLLRAVIAVYPAEGANDSRAGRLPGEPSRTRGQQGAAVASQKGTGVLRVFDADNNGISFNEYQLILTFLKIPVQDVTVIFSMFDLNSDGSVHLEEFEQITTDDSRGLKAHFFGEKGDKALDLSAFTAFMEDLHEAMIRLEFEHYANGGPTMSGLDFARSVVSSVDTAKVDLYLDRAAALPQQLAQAQVTFDQFRQVATLHQQIHRLAVALQFFHSISGKLEKRDFARATKLVSGSEVAPHLVDIVYYLFDLNGDGSLSAQELIGVLRNREGSRYDKMAGEEDRSQGLMSCVYGCLFENR